jgi:hypothetical protein
VFRYIVAAPSKVRLLHFNGKFRLVKDAAREVNASCAVNFGFFAPGAKPVPVGQVMLNGANVVLGDPRMYQHFYGVYRKDGEVKFWHWLPGGCEWGVRAGPQLIEMGTICEMSIRDPAWPAGGVNVNIKKPRVAIGTRADGMTVLAYWDDLTVREGAMKLLELGCVDALAGDGGGSASWYTPDVQIGARAVPNMIYVEGDTPPIEEPTLVLPKVDLVTDPAHKLTANFTLGEFACKCGCGAVSVSPKFGELVARLQMLREKVGKPVHVTSGYRCAKHDAKVGTSSDPGAGPHTTGTAADIYVSGISVDRLAALAKECGFTGIGRYRQLAFVHVDLRQPAGEWEA